MRFCGPINVRIVNHLTKRPYFLIGACELEIEAGNIERITSICNEPDVYDWLFRKPLSGKPYPEEKARQWLEWARAGWTANSHFIFAVISEAKDIAAACQIKSNDDVAEVGYWASHIHRGVMTDAVSAMCLLAANAGFRELYASTNEGNTRSEAVLSRVGFVRVPGVRSDNRSRFELLLKGLPYKKVVPNQLPDPTSPSVTPAASAGGAPFVAVDH
jgi:RimJ/RimL family protein N-acetyltransferase